MSRPEAIPRPDVATPGVETAWSRFWFGLDATLPLEILRIGTGIGLLIAFGGITGELQALYGDSGWISRQAMAALDPQGPPSLFLLVAEPWQVGVLHGLFLGAFLALALGWRTRWAKWVAWAGLLSYVGRNPAVVYGLDHLLACQLFLLCLAPVGRSLSLDNLRRRGGGEQAALPSASTCLRLLQIQMAVVFFFAGAQKLRGEPWWSGEAVWVALNNFELSQLSTAWLASHFWAVTLLAHGTVLLEISYPFVVWHRRARPWIVAAAVVFHVGTAALMGLRLFAFVAVVGHLAFVPPQWVERWLEGLRDWSWPSVGWLLGTAQRRATLVGGPSRRQSLHHRSLRET